MRKNHEKNENGLTFFEFMRKVDLYVLNTIGLGVDDLPDALHYDAWEDSLSSQEWAEDLLEENFGDAWR